MSDLSNNIRFSYLYRDAGNYKLFGETIFSNADGLSLIEIETRIKSSLIDAEFFSAEEWGIIPLEFEETDEELDHGWHEYEGIEMTKKDLTYVLTMLEFIQFIESKYTDNQTIQS